MYELDDKIDYSKTLPIPVAGGRVAYVDREDFFKVAKYRWGWDGRYPKQGPNRMHSLIIGKSKGKVVDHKNGNTLDNRKENLRFVTQFVNCLNTSKSKGYYQRKDGNFVCRFQILGRSYRICSNRDELIIKEKARLARKIIIDALLNECSPIQAVNMAKVLLT